MCISPLLRDINETRCTLDFGLRALKITSTAYVNVEVNCAVICSFHSLFIPPYALVKSRPAGFLEFTTSIDGSLKLKQA